MSIDRGRLAAVFLKEVRVLRRNRFTGARAQRSAECRGPGSPPGTVPRIPRIAGIDGG